MQASTRAMAILFILIAIAVFFLNHPLFTLINHAHSAATDVFFGSISGLGDGLVVTLGCSALMLWHLRAGIAGLLAFVVSGLLAQLIKHMVDMPRPPAILEHVHVLGAPLRAHSFPSGHATSDGVMLLLCFYLWGMKDWRSWLGAVLFSLAAYGRIYGGVHFPLDVWCGLGIGMVCMVWFWQQSARWPVEVWQRSVWAWRLPLLAVVIEAGILGLGYAVQPVTSGKFVWMLSVLSLLLVMQRVGMKKNE